MSAPKTSAAGKGKGKALKFLLLAQTQDASKIRRGLGCLFLHNMLCNPGRCSPGTGIQRSMSSCNKQRRAPQDDQQRAAAEERQLRQPVTRREREFFIADQKTRIHCITAPPVQKYPEIACRSRHHLHRVADKRRDVNASLGK
jgi:hypothetical protein